MSYVAITINICITQSKRFPAIVIIVGVVAFNINAIESSINGIERGNGKKPLFAGGNRHFKAIFLGVKSLTTGINVIIRKCLFADISEEHLYAVWFSKRYWEFAERVYFYDGNVFLKLGKIQNDGRVVTSAIGQAIETGG